MCSSDLAQDLMVLIGELVNALNLYTDVGVTHHSNMNNNSKTKVASKRLWMQQAQFNWVFLTWFLCFVSKFFVTIFFMFLFSFISRICIALHYIHAFHIRLFLFVFFFLNHLKKMERGMWKDVFCITYHGCVVKVGHIIFA